jgi:hypothetical protein
MHAAMHGRPHKLAKGKIRLGGASIQGLKRPTRTALLELDIYRPRLFHTQGPMALPSASTSIPDAPHGAVETSHRHIV